MKSYTSPATRRALKEEAGKPTHFLDRNERRKVAKRNKLERKADDYVSVLDIAKQEELYNAGLNV